MKYNSFVHAHMLKSIASIGSILFISLLLLNPAPYAQIFQPTVSVNADFLYNGYDTSMSYQLNTEDMQPTVVDTTSAIKSYIVQPGETIEQIAQNYAVSVNQIKTVNNLIDNDLLAGQRLYLTTLPGVIYPVKEEQISLMVFANKYGVAEDKLLEVNNQNNNQIPYERGQAIFVPDISLDQAYNLGLLIKPEPKPEPIVAPVRTRIAQNTPSRSVSSSYQAKPSTSNQTIANTYYGGGSSVVSSYRSSFKEVNGMAAGQCTYYAAHKATFAFPEVSPGVRFRGFGGNANKRLSNARAAGFKTSSKPTPGAIAVFQGGYGYYSGYGHVAIVEEVDTANHRMKVSEMNYQGIWIVTVRWIQLDESMTRASGGMTLLGFIPPQDLPSDVQARYDAARS